MAQTESESLSLFSMKEPCTMHDCYSCGVFIKATVEERQNILHGYDYKKMSECVDCCHRPTLTCNREEVQSD